MWKTLGTSDYDKAVTELAKEMDAFDKTIKSAWEGLKPATTREAQIGCRGTGTTRYLLKAHIPALLERYSYACLVADDKERQGSTKSERDERLKRLIGLKKRLGEQQAAGDRSTVDETAVQLLAVECLIAPPGSKVSRELIVKLHQRAIEVLKIQCGRLRGNYTLTPDICPTRPRDMPTMLNLHDKWKEGKTNQRTIDTYRGFVAEFEALVTALPVASITLSHGDALRDHLVQQGLNKATIINYVDGLATLFRNGMKKGLVLRDDNPFDKVDMDGIPDRLESEKRRAFSVAELNILFNSSLYCGGEPPIGQAAEAARWVLILTTFASPRIEEAAQLRMEDILRINGVWTLRISNLDPAQKVKTSSSFRFVPMHEELIKCGFLAYVAAQKLAGHKRVFPSLKNNNKHKIFSNALGKWFSRYLDSEVSDDDRLCHHSLRFSFKQQCVLSGIHPEIRDALSGHWLSKKDAARGYVKSEHEQYPFPALVTAIGQLRYDELDLSHLHVAEPMANVELAFPRIDWQASPTPVKRVRGRRKALAIASESA